MFRAHRELDNEIIVRAARSRLDLRANTAFSSGENSVNIEPAQQRSPKGPASHDHEHSGGEGAAASGRVESVSFSIGEEQYGIDIMAVREIKGWSEITHLPKQPDYVRGVLNLRGVMVPIIDLRCRFGQGKTEATPLRVVIVVQVESRLGRPAGRRG